MRAQVGAAGLAVAAVAAVTVTVAFTVLDWLPKADDFGWTGTSSQPHYSPATLPDIAEAGGLPALAGSYVTWLGWVLLAVACGAACAGSVARDSAAWWRLGAGTAALAGAGLTWLATDSLTTTYPADNAFGDTAADGLADAYAGPWIAITGFALCGAAAALGPWGSAERPDRAARPVRAWFARTWHGDRRTAISLGLACAALALLVAAIGSLTWYHQGWDYDAPSDVDFALLHQNFGLGSTRLARAYLSSLAWVFALVPFALLIVANARAALARWARVAAVPVVLTAGACTYLALHQAFEPHGGVAGSGVFDGARLGVYATFGAYALYLAAAICAAPRTPADTMPA